MLYFQGKIASENLKVEAALHGAKIDQGESEPKAEAEQIMFKDPKEYEKLSPEERTRLTQKMMGHFGGMNLPGMGKPKIKKG